MQKQTKANSPVTEYAAKAIEELFNSGYVVLMLDANVQATEAELQEDYKRTGLTPRTNKSFNDAARSFLGRSLLCLSVDMYNWYCQMALHLAIDKNPTSVPKLLENVDRFETIIRKGANRGIAPAKALLDHFKMRTEIDSVVRKAIHTHLDVQQGPETELLCICRNLLVHHCGFDAKGEVPAKLAEIGSARSFVGATSFPQNHLPIGLDSSGKIKIDPSIGRWAADFLRQEIFLMDQQLGHIYSLPRFPRPRLSISQIHVGKRS